MSTAIPSWSWPCPAVEGIEWLRGLVAFGGHAEGVTLSVGVMSSSFLRLLLTYRSFGMYHRPTSQNNIALIS